MSEMTGSGGSILCFTVAENSSFCSDLSQTQISGWMEDFESLFSNPSVPCVGFLCGPTTTNKSLPTSFPAPQQFQGMTFDSVTIGISHCGGRALEVGVYWKRWHSVHPASAALSGATELPSIGWWAYLYFPRVLCEDAFLMVSISKTTLPAELLVLNRTPREGGEWGLPSHPCSASSKAALVGLCWLRKGWRLKDRCPFLSGSFQEASSS